MNARTSRSAQADPGTNDNYDKRTGLEPDLAFDDLLDARFDEEGRLAEVGRGGSKRVTERLDPRPPATSAEELERAVRKLAEGLDAIERQSRSTRPAAPAAQPAARHVDRHVDREFVTHSLDRLEARLEALSQRLQRRGADDADDTADAHVSDETQPSDDSHVTADSLVSELAPAPTIEEPAHDEPSLGAEPDYAADTAELRRLAEAEAERVRREAEAEAAAEREAAEAKRIAEEEERRAKEKAAALRKAEEEEAEAKRLAEEEAIEAKRRAEAEALELKRQAEEEAAEARRIAEEEAAETRRIAEQEAAETRRRAEAAEAEARRHAALAEEERLERVAGARREAEATAEMERQFADIETRLDALQENVDANQIAPVREELIELLHEIEDLSHNRSSVAVALDQIGERLGAMEAKVNAARNMAGNRLGDIQDRLTHLTGRLDEVEVEIPGFDAIRENQGAILERFDRMEGLVHHLASPEELHDRVEGLRRELTTIATQDEVAGIEAHILSLAERLDALPEALSDEEALQQIESQLGMLATELADAREQRTTSTAELDQRLSELSGLLGEVAESARAPDLSGLEERIAAFDARLEEDRRASAEALTRLERRLAALATAIEEQEDGAAATAALADLTLKIDSLAETIEAQDPSEARRDIETLGGKLDRLAEQLAEQAEHLSRAEVKPLESRLDHMQSQLNELTASTQTSSDQLRPFANRLQDISERLSRLGADDASTPLSQRLEAIEERLATLGNANGHKGPDPRALQTQLEGIISRLELLKGRSIDPARLNDLFDRADATIRALPEDRFERLERRLANAAIPSERLEQLERRLTASATAGISDEDIERLARRVAESARQSLAEAGAPDISEDRFTRLEQKLEAIGLASTAESDELPSAEDLSELREDITSLRSELRTRPGLDQGETQLGQMLRDIASRMERLPEAAPATAADLEAQVERIATLLDDPSHSRLALAHIETSLKTIEERLDDTRRALSDRPAEAADSSEVEAVAGMARALSDDVASLKDSTKTSEKGTKAALDAVQATLQSVIKRMTFLERGGDAASEAKAESDAGPAAKSEPPVFAAEEQPEPIAPEAAAAIVERFESATPEKTEEIETTTAEAKLETPEAVETAAEASEAAAEPAPSRTGLLSRFTSRQLLRRATGGRAESFTPEPEENEDDADFPIEPGTDSPLNSALSGAPSSDTQLLSGDRGKGRTQPVLGAELGIADASLEPDADVDEDFLASARRAARAAAAEAEAGESVTESQGLGHFVKSRRTALLAAALTVAVAFAALQIVRSQIGSGESEVAAIPQTGAPAAPADDMADDMAATTPSESAPTPAETAATVEPPSEGEASTPTPTMASAASDTSAPTAPAGDDMAALGPMTGEEPATAPTTSGTDMQAAPAAPAAEQPLPELPVRIGSQRLRDAAVAGNPAAAFEVASRYAEGASGLQDMPTAVAWYERAAATGLAPAQYRLGSVYEKGLGVSRDLAKAQDWYRRAADAGNVKAMHNLAVLYAEGAGGEPDLERAAELFRQAAEHGVRDSQFNLAILHARGLGVKEDLIEAYKWFAVAATSGDEESAKRRDIIAAALPEEDLAIAQAAAASFQPLPLISEANEVLMPDGGWSDKQDSSSVETQPTPEQADIGSTLSENDMVALVQKLLTDNGFNPGPTDGLLGQQTIDAILSFQTQSGLPATGQIDPKLLEALKGVSG